MPHINPTHLEQLMAPDYQTDFAHIRRGLEKEGLRVDRQGRISQKDHPKALGSALTHPHITTDYSEALLEFITPALTSPNETADFLYRLHAFTQQNLDDELIWGCSMPCHIANELDIRIAEYGSSNIGQLKHVYRHGLWHRYGRLMQSIAGIHYNYSMPDSFWEKYQALLGDKQSVQDFRSERYFGLIRNFKRYSWLLIYLFGASPAVSASFVDGKTHKLQSGLPDTLYAPKGTSLRMSDLGYQNSAQSDLTICYNSLENYIYTLSHAVKTPHLPYEELGVQNNQGGFNQLNTNLLQIENEFYSDIRPKRTTQANEKPLEALSSRGVEYIEVRCLDINPFLATGIDTRQIAFMDTFLTFCLLADSPEVEPAECNRLAQNMVGMAYEGADPNKRILLEGQSFSIKGEGGLIFEQMAQVADILDQSHRSESFSDAIKHYHTLLSAPELLPSHQQIDWMTENNASFHEFGLEMSRRHAKELSEYPLSQSFIQEMTEKSQLSIGEQENIEKSDKLSFIKYLEDFSNT
ncbi:glutamate--cysteine ligase [Litoribrevibacter albus]|uniref:Glutamate--cysteine ligase n=1 Tax=Litoribrevibacter albus TaxID=1473156 RepID=A0AA37SER3_9GAMM|nr:glutamate--cysteine ligase [Litoribrevibacter albus]GLQ33122.1 glutamate--cysteine ligase [Litoribrevibacter albus]